jgi:hypothetical protein
MPKEKGGRQTASSSFISLRYQKGGGQNIGTKRAGIKNLQPCLVIHPRFHSPPALAEHGEDEILDARRVFIHGVVSSVARCPE